MYIRMHAQTELQFTYLIYLELSKTLRILYVNFLCDNRPVRKRDQLVVPQTKLF